MERAFLGKLKEEHRKLLLIAEKKEANPEILLEHFIKEELYLSKFSPVLGKALEMIRAEHELLIKLLKEENWELFLSILKYHIEKEEKQVFPMIESSVMQIEQN
jgi:hemerythrin-like domain-containing protein